MKLSLLSEAASIKKQEFLAKKFQVDPSMVQQASDTDPTRKGRYTEWIISRIKSGDIDLNRDAPKVSSALTDFEAISNKKLARQQYGLKDINQYNLEDIVSISNTYKGEAGPKPESMTKPADSGVNKVYDDGVIGILKITDPDSAVKLAGGTKWCTSKREIAEDYLSKGPLYVIYKNGKKFAQTDGRSQLVDLQDEEIWDLDFVKTLHKAGIDVAKFWIDYITNPAAEEEEKQREPELERHIIKKHPALASQYARSVIGGRWPEAEPTIIKDPEAASSYATNALKGRWPEAEPTIMKDPGSAYQYAKNALKGRWPEAEPTIMKDPEAAKEYAINIIKGRWPEAEPTIMKDPGSAYWYAAHALKGRWPEAEPTIMKDPKVANHYARSVIGGRWPEAEPTIMKDANSASSYAAHVLKGRWPEAEPTIMKNAWATFLYTQDAIRNRWPEAEPIMAKDPYIWSFYKDKFGLDESKFESRINKVLGLL